MIQDLRKRNGDRHREEYARNSERDLLRGNKARLQQRVTELQAEVTRLQAEVVDLRAKTDSQAAELQVLQRENQQFRDWGSRHKRERNALQAELDALHRQRRRD